MNGKALAIAYSMQRKPKKLAEGGDVAENGPTISIDPQGASSLKKAFSSNPFTRKAHGGEVNEEEKGVHKSRYNYPIDSEAGESRAREGGKKEHEQVLSELKSMQKPKLQGLAEGGGVSCPSCGYMAEGGFVPGEAHAKALGHETEHEEKLQPEMADFGQYHAKSNSPAAKESDRMLNQHGQKEQGPNGFSKGGFIGSHQSESDEFDMVGRIMAQKQKHFSEGGKVANDVHEFDADFEDPNKFDYLASSDDLESGYDGENAGDYAGDEGEDSRRSDIVERIMKSRKKKDKLPNPA